MAISQIKAEIKALQTMAVLCSLLKYFAYVIVGVTRVEDLALIKSEVSSLQAIWSILACTCIRTHVIHGITSQVALLGEAIVSRVHVQMLNNLAKPANLPFHLLEFAKQYIKKVNSCLDAVPPETLDNALNDCNQYFLSFVNEQKAVLGPTPVGWKVKFLYYTESDQIVKFRDIHVRDAILSATNMTTMFIGRRLEKDWKSPPEEFMNGLIITRSVCGLGLYTLDWPASHYVYKVNASEYEQKTNTTITVPIPGIDIPEQDQFRPAAKKKKESVPRPKHK